MPINDNVPNYNRRADDKTIEGRNRTRVNLGTDRQNTRESGHGFGGANDPDSGTIDIVAGYDGSDVDFDNDKSRIYVSGKTNPDEYFSVESGNKKSEIPAIVQKSDCIYILGRECIKLVKGNFSIIIDGGNITIQKKNGLKINLSDDKITVGEGDEQRIIRGEDFRDWARNLTIPSPMGPLQINPLDIEKIEQILSRKVEIE